MLKDARFQLLQLHKLLVDNERAAFEKINGQMTSGQFLNFLINEKDFDWLKRFSDLIVEIDEMFDLDDGASAEMIETQFLKMKNLVELNSADDEFKSKYKGVLQNNSEIDAKHRQLSRFLEKNKKA